MPSFAPKHAILYRFDKQPLEAFVEIETIRSGLTVELMSRRGALEAVPHESVKAICLISELGDFDLFRRNSLFERRPRIAGLWTRFMLRDGDRLDGILPYNLLDWPESSFMLIPPRSGPTRQRVFLPRRALIGAELRGVVGKSGLVGRLVSPEETAPHLSARSGQLRMFD